VLTADAVAFLVAGGKLVQAPAAHASLPAREETLRGRQTERFVDTARADLAAQVQMPALGEVEDALALQAQLDEGCIGAERAR
jgi:hypothetical protein